MGIIDKRVAIGRVNKDSTGQSHEIRFDRRVDGRLGCMCTHAKTSPFLSETMTVPSSSTEMTLAFLIRVL